MELLLTDLRPEKRLQTSNLMLYTGKSSWKASTSQIGRKLIWKFVLVGGPLCAIPTKTSATALSDM